MSTIEFRQFICRACGLVYDEAMGDADSGLAPGTRFDDIPEDWSCPLCGVTKADFEPMVTSQGTALPPAAAGDTAGCSMGGSAQASARVSARVAARVSTRVAARMSARSSQASPAGGLMQRAGVVIVGAGTAGWTLAEQLRARSAELPVTLVSACTADRYDKPRLSVALHQGLSAADLPRETGAQAAERLGVRLLANTAVSGISMASRTLRTARGAIAFDDLVLAHGARARSCDGLPDALTWRINDLASYRGLRAALERLERREGVRAQQTAETAETAKTAETAAESAFSRQRAEPSLLPWKTDAITDVILVGAGLVGCELANDLALAGYSVRLLEAGPRPLPMATPEQSQALLAAWSGLPLVFEGGVTVRSAHRRTQAHAQHQGRKHAQNHRQANPGAASDDAGDIELVAADGRCFVGRVLVSAVGLSTPNRLALQAGLRDDNGIAVDPYTLSTGVPGVHALGDCISINGQPQRFIEPIFRQARLIADRICKMDGGQGGLYNTALPPIRVKTTSLPLTLAA